MMPLLPRRNGAVPLAEAVPAFQLHRGSFLSSFRKVHACIARLGLKLSLHGINSEGSSTNMMMKWRIRCMISTVSYGISITTACN